MKNKPKPRLTPAMGGKAPRGGYAPRKPLPKAVPNREKNKAKRPKPPVCLENHRHPEVQKFVMEKPQAFHDLYNKGSYDDVDAVIPYDEKKCPHCHVELNFYLVHFRHSRARSPWSGREKWSPWTLPTSGWILLEAEMMVRVFDDIFDI